LIFRSVRSISSSATRRKADGASTERNSVYQTAILNKKGMLCRMSAQDCEYLCNIIKQENMDYEEFMSYAPKDCQPTVITMESRWKDWAKRIGKKVEDLTEEDKKEEAESWDIACNTPCDWMNS
jgi:thioredoxin-related protein